MPVLNKLTPELKDALGQMSNLASRYDVLLEKSKGESLRDNQEAINYVDDVIKRYQTLKATSPHTTVLQAKKESYLDLVKQHAAEISVYSFSKPTDIGARLKQLDFAPDAIAEITKKIEQAGGDEDTFAILLSSFITSELTLADCGGSHHHGHRSRF